VRSILKLGAVAGVACALGIGVAVAAPAMAATTAAPQYKITSSSGNYGAYAACPTGYTVTGGGFTGTPGPPDYNFYSRPEFNLRGWMVGGAQGYVAVYAICVSNS
jgi:hypothetical protein